MDHTNQFPSLNQGDAQLSNTNPSIPTNDGYGRHLHHSNFSSNSSNGNQFPSLNQGVAQWSSTNPSILTNEYERHLYRSNIGVDNSYATNQFVNVNQGVSESAMMMSVPSTVKHNGKEDPYMSSLGQALDLHFKASGDDEVTLPLMILYRNVLFPESLQMKYSNGTSHYLYACHWQHKPSTADEIVLDFIGSEKSIITRFNSSNGFTFGNHVNSKKPYSTGIRKIHRGKCSGFGKKTSTCDIVPLWIRISGNLVLYFSTGIGTKSMLDIRHSPNCIRARRCVVPFEIIQRAVRLTNHKNKARKALQTFRKSDDASTINKSLLRNGIDIQSAKGVKKFSRVIGNQMQSEKKRQKKVIADARKPSSFSDVTKIINENVMGIDEFCEHASNEEYIFANMDKTVVLADDVGTKADMRCSGFVFTTIGRLFILSKVIEMYEWKKINHLGDSAITMQIDGLVVLKSGTLKAVHLAFSDFLHQTYVVFFAISREEDKVISMMIMKVAMEVILKLGGPNGRLYMLLDGGRALHAAAIELGFIPENCKHHMSDRTTGIGTAGYNQCGSLGRYLMAKQIDKMARSLFEWTNQNLFFMFLAKEQQRIATLMLYKYMLGVWLPKESKGEIEAMVEPTATLDQVYEFIKNDFKNYAALVAGDNIEINQVNHGREKHKCFKIIIWFVHYYFKILGESPFTHGSIHNAGDPLNTNGLEGTNYPFQSHSSELYESTACNEIEAYMMCVQQKTVRPDNFQVSPSSTMDEWDKVWQYCGYKKTDRVPIPYLFRYIFGFEGNGKYNHIPWDELLNELTSIGKDATVEKKIILYLPTRCNYDQTSVEARELLNLELNPGGYPSNSKPAKRIFKQEDLFPILYPAFVKQLYGKHDSFIACASFHN